MFAWAVYGQNSNDSSGTAPVQQKLRCRACAANDVAGINGDRLAVFYYAGKRTTRNCQGGIVAAGTSVVNVFWVNANRELVCGVLIPPANAWSAVAAPLLPMLNHHTVSGWHPQRQRYYLSTY